MLITVRPGLLFYLFSSRTPSNITDVKKQMGRKQTQLLAGDVGPLSTAANESCCWEIALLLKV